MNLKAAINQSIETESTVQVEVAGDLLEATMGVPGWAGEFYYVEEKEGTLDVWGTDWDGNNWKLKLVAA